MVKLARPRLTDGRNLTGYGGKLVGDAARLEEGERGAGGRAESKRKGLRERAL